MCLLDDDFGRTSLGINNSLSLKRSGPFPDSSSSPTLIPAYSLEGLSSRSSSIRNLSTRAIFIIPSKNDPRRLRLRVEIILMFIDNYNFVNLGKEMFVFGLLPKEEQRHGWQMIIIIKVIYLRKYLSSLIWQ